MSAAPAWMTIHGVRSTAEGLEYSVSARRWHPAWWVMCWRSIRESEAELGVTLGPLLFAWLFLRAVVRGLR